MSREKPCLSSRQAKLIVITGPTATGKTGLSIELALWLNKYKHKPCRCPTSTGLVDVGHLQGDSWVEIVAADSRQVYKEMDIGTAKPFKQEMQGIPHHLFSIISPNQEFSVAEYKKLAEQKIREIISRGRIPFLVGGSPFYVFSITKGWTFPKVEPDWDLREKLQKKSEKELFQQLKKLDPRRAQTIDKQNKRRLIRGIEITKEKGEVPELKTEPKFDCLVLGIKINKTELRKRIFERVDKMVKQGLEQEVKKLTQKYGWQSPALQNTIGYQEWQAYFENKISKQQVIEQIKTSTWQFSKRQQMWFKREKNIHWIATVEQAKKLVKECLHISTPPFHAARP